MVRNVPYHPICPGSGACGPTSDCGETLPCREGAGPAPALLDGRGCPDVPCRSRRSEWPLVHWQGANPTWLTDRMPSRAHTRCSGLGPAPTVTRCSGVWRWPGSSNRTANSAARAFWMRLGSCRRRMPRSNPACPRMPPMRGGNGWRRCVRGTVGHRWMGVHALWNKGLGTPRSAGHLTWTRKLCVTGVCRRHAQGPRGRPQWTAARTSTCSDVAPVRRLTAPPPNFVPEPERTGRRHTLPGNHFARVSRL